MKPSLLLILLGSIILETIATTTVKATDGFTKLGPSLVVLVGYVISFYGLSLVVQKMNVGVAYALWGGAGILLVSIMSFVVYHQALDKPALLGIGLIILGIVVISGFSHTVTH